MSGVRKPNRKGFPPNLYQDKNGYFSYRNPQSGKRRGIGKDKATAFREARAANAVLANMQPSSLAAWVTGISLTSVVDWLPQYEAKWIENRDQPLAKNTIRTSKLLHARIAAADFAKLSIDKVTAQHISLFLTSIAETGGKTTIVSMRSRLNDIFRVAEVSGLIAAGTNPVPATEAKLAKAKRERMSLEQFLAIRDHADTPVTTRNAMNLALVTGQRRDEVSRMKFADMHDGFLHVVQGKSQGWTKLQLDTSIRLNIVGLSIEDVVKQCRDRVLSPYMVHRTKKRGKLIVTEPLSVHQITDDCSTARDRAGVVALQPGHTPPTFHEIRSLSQRLYRDQYGPEFAQAIMGHKDAKTTEVYDDMRVPMWRVVTAK
jgi:integrase